MLTQKRLREVLNYDPNTGIFTWKKGARRGKIAGTLHDERGFLKVSIDNKRYFLNRLAWLWMNGYHPLCAVDHKNGDHGDNRWCNLEVGAGSVKAAHSAPYLEPTAFEGVYQAGDHFEALIKVGEVMLNIGNFETAELASEARTATIDGAREKQRQRVRVSG